MNNDLATILEGCGLPYPAVFVRRLRRCFTSKIPSAEIEVAVWECLFRGHVSLASAALVLREMGARPRVRLWPRRWPDRVEDLPKPSHPTSRVETIEERVRQQQRYQKKSFQQTYGIEYWRSTRRERFRRRHLPLRSGVIRERKTQVTAIPITPLGRFSTCLG